MAAWHSASAQSRGGAGYGATEARFLRRLFVFKSFPHFVLLLAGAVAAIIGLSAIVGWHAQNAFLVQWSPRFAAADYTTALGFLAAGAGLIALARDRGRAAAACGGIAFVIGCSALIAQLLGVNLGIEHYLAKHSFMPDVATSGRASPNAALSLIIIGVALFAAAKRMARKQPLLILGMMGALVVALSLAVLFGHLRGMQSAYGWAADERTGAVTMVGFMVLGAGVLASAWHLSDWQTADRPHWVAALGGLCIFLLSMLLWRILALQERVQFDQIIEAETVGLSREIGPLLQSRIASLKRIAKRQEARNASSLHEWESEAALYIGYQDSRTIIGWLNADFKLRAAAPREKSGVILAAARTSEDVLRKAAQEVQGQSSAVFTRVSRAQDDLEFLIAAPLERGGRADGFVVSVFSLKTALAPILTEKFLRGYSVAITGAGQPLYQSDARGGLLDREWGREASFRIGNAVWQVRVWPRAGRLAKAQSDTPETALAVGFIIAFLVMLVVELNYAARRHAIALEEVSSRLREEVAERKNAHEELEKLTGELTRSNQELQQFAYVASHDLQEPLRMVVSYMQLVERRYRDKLDDDGKEFIHFAVDGASRMQKLIQSLLTYSRVASKGKPLEPTPLERAFEQALSNLCMAIEETGATVTRDELPTVLADETQFMQLFQNLLGNAIKFHGTEPPRVHVSVEDKGDEWLFSVRDNGIGFDPQYAERIFVIFQRLQRRDEYPGTGIGLSVCKKIVERHGGSIRAESQIDRGAVFYFTIPKLERTVQI